MRVGFIGDIVGKPGRVMLEANLNKLKKEFDIDFVIANAENASHGFGLTAKHSSDLFGYGVDVITGGNHSWDRKEIIPLMDKLPILRPLNYPDGTVGNGFLVFEVKGEKIAVVNIMGHFAMPMCDNPFLCAKKCVDELKNSGVKTIIVDFHAEATSEKRAMYLLLKGGASAVLGTHTHIGTDDLMVEDGSCYVSDVGATGARDGVIGMDKAAPLKRFTTGLPAAFEIPEKCKKIFQILIMDFCEGRCERAFKVRLFDDRERIVTEAFYE